MGELTIGLQLCTVIDYEEKPQDIPKTLEKVSEIGYRVVQPGRTLGMDPKELRKLLDDNGLHACSTHSGYDLTGMENGNDIDREIEVHKILGCEAIICGIAGKCQNEEGYSKVAGHLEKVMPKLKENGLALGYHIHGLEFAIHNGRSGLDILLGKCPELKIEVDTYWVQYGGGDPAFWIEKLAGRLTDVHFKDMANAGAVEGLWGQQIMPPIGVGNLNWQRIVKACRKADAGYCLVEIDRPTIDALEAVRISFENMKNWGLEP